MKNKSAGRRVLLGIFMIAGVVLFTALVFYIGSRQHIFGSRKEVVTMFKNVSGLVEGNMVRFSGVNVGTIKKIEIVSDSLVAVTLHIDKDVARFIKIDSEASIHNDGLIGTKFLSISAGSPYAQVISDGDTISSKAPYEIEQFISLLQQTGESATRITGNLENITSKINNGEGTLGMLVSDKSLHNKVSNLVTSFEHTGHNANVLTKKLVNVVDTLSVAGRNSVTITENMAEFTAKLNNENSTLGKLVADTTMAAEVDETLTTVKRAARDIEVTSCKVRNSWIMRMFSR
ncbi:MAG: MlaD family protein [Cytophagaceae bacterium]